MNKNKQKIIVILGPTSSGKTSLAVSLAKHFNGEIISADSRQVYIGMDIGSGKEGEKAMVDLDNIGRVPIRIIDQIPQYLIDVIPPSETFTLADFIKQSNLYLKNILHRNKTPFIVGGTNLYISALTHGYSLPSADHDEMELRKKLERLSEADLLMQLKILDPQSYKQIDHRNLRRVIRALSVTISSGMTFSSLQKKSEFPHDVLYLGIEVPRVELYQKIDQRVDDRIKVGMIEEVQGLLNQGISKEKLISFGLEYRFITLYLTGEIPSKDEMIEKLKFATHAYARRQITWLNHQLPVIWIKNEQEATTQIQKFLT